MAQQALIQQLVQQSNLLKHRIELICSHALQKQRQQQALEQQQRQLEQEQAAAEEEEDGVEQQEAAQHEAQQQQQQPEGEELRLTMSGARQLADKLLALLDKQQLSASGAVAALQAGAAEGSPSQQQGAAATAAAAAAAAAAGWQQQLKQQLQESSSALLGASTGGSSVDQQKVQHAMFDAHAIVQGLLPQRNTSSAGGSFVIGTIPSASVDDEHPAGSSSQGGGQQVVASSAGGGRGGGEGGVVSRLGPSAHGGAGRPLDLDLDLSSPEDTAAPGGRTAGSTDPTAHQQQQQHSDGVHEQQLLPFQQHHRLQLHHGLQIQDDSAVSSLESDFARRTAAAPTGSAAAAAATGSNSVGATPSGRAAGADTGASAAAGAMQRDSSSATAAAGAGVDEDGSVDPAGVTWYYSALGGEYGWDTSPGGHEEGAHGSATAAAAAAQAAKAASEAAVRASSGLLGAFGLDSSREGLDEGAGCEGYEDGVSPQEQRQGQRLGGLGLSGHHLEGGDGDLESPAFATPQAVGPVGGMLGANSGSDSSGSALRQRWNMFRLRLQQQGPDDGGRDDQEEGVGGGMQLQVPRWAGQPAWAVAGVSGYR